MRSYRTSKRRVIIGIIVAIVLIAAFGLVMYLIEHHGLLDEQFGDTGGWDEDEEQIEISLDDKDYFSDDKIDAYLLIGTDAGGKDMGENYNGTLADFLTLVLVDSTTEKYAFIQLDRNTIVEMEVPNDNGDFDTYEQQLCTAHWYGKTDEQRNINTVEAVQEVLGGLEIDHFYTISMGDLDAVNHALGGITVDIQSDLTSVDPAFVQGASVTLTDEQAEKFIRARMGVGEGTNQERMSRQTQYIQSAYNKMMGELKEHPEYINDIYEELKGKLQTDEESGDLSQLTNQMLQYESQGIIRIEGKVREADTLGDGVLHEEFYPAEGAVYDALTKVINLEEIEVIEE